MRANTAEIAPTPNRLLKNAKSTLRVPQGERKSSIHLGRGSAHAEALEAWGGVLQRAAKSVSDLTTRSDPTGNGPAAPTPTAGPARWPDMPTWFLLALILLTALLYAPVRHNGFVNFDDLGYIAKNPH